MSTCKRCGNTIDREAIERELRERTGDIPSTCASAAEGSVYCNLGCSLLDLMMFVLLGRDPMAGSLVREWAEWRRQQGEDPAKVAEAEACADAMDKWAESLGKRTLKRAKSKGDTAK